MREVLYRSHSRIRTRNSPGFYEGHMTHLRTLRVLIREQPLQSHPHISMSSPPPPSSETERIYTKLTPLSCRGHVTCDGVIFVICDFCAAFCDDSLTCPCDGMYRGTSTIRNSARLGPYSRNMPRALWWSWGGSRFVLSEVPLYTKLAPSHVGDMGHVSV